MKTIKVLGSGCANCETTAKLIKQIAEDMQTEVAIEKVEDIAQIMAYGVMSTPGVVIDEKVIHAGGIPDKESIKSWLLNETSGCCSGSNNDSGCCS